MAEDGVATQLHYDVTPGEYDVIRALWKAHSIAEDGRDIAGLIATLTVDCVYELPQTGHRWVGHDGARRFYTELLHAFPDIEFALLNIVIGPQGVWEEARARGTHRGAWLGLRATDELITFIVSIFFPWDRARMKFSGERIYVHGVPGLPSAVQTATD